MTNNMRVWDAVEKTDPAHTKKVNQRGGFTAVSAAYQIMSATKQFGPIGIDWGYDAGSPIFQNNLVIIPVTLWHGDRQNTFGPVYGCAELVAKTKNGDRVDSDAPKKAGTDALTKLLSQLGFNADVFLGKFDDNKYVAEVNAEYREAEKPGQTEEVERLTFLIEQAQDGAALDAIKAAEKQAINALNDASFGLVKAAFGKAKARIEAPQEKQAA